MKLEKYKYTFTLIITLIMTACADDRSGLQEQEVMKNETLEKKLVEKGYTNLFLSDDLYLQDIWQEGKNVKEFELIVKSETSSLSAKFLANEVLNYYSIPSPPSSIDELAEAYVFALEQTGVNKVNELQLNANVWGFLYELDDAGPIGTKLVSFGIAAKPFLMELLSDTCFVFYAGSKKATVGNSYHYRIKDFATFYLSKITKIPIKFSKVSADRDREIENFKKLIKQGK